jgi:hypothetical protein
MYRDGQRIILISIIIACIFYAISQLLFILSLALVFVTVPCIAMFICCRNCGVIEQSVNNDTDFHDWLHNTEWVN